MVECNNFICLKKKNGVRLRDFVKVLHVKKIKLLISCGIQDAMIITEAHTCSKYKLFSNHYNNNNREITLFTPRNIMYHRNLESIWNRFNRIVIIPTTTNSVSCQLSRRIIIEVYEVSCIGSIWDCVTRRYNLYIEMDTVWTFFFGNAIQDTGWWWKIFVWACPYKKY